MRTKMIDRDRLASLLADTYGELCEVREWPSLPPEAQAVERKSISEIQAARVDTMALIAISRMDGENAALKRTVEDLAHALRNLNRIFEERGQPRTASAIRTTLERHGLLRDVDRPEMTQVFREEPSFAGHCACCGAVRGQPCNPNCEDRR